MSDSVIYETEGRIAKLILNRPEKFNCISRSLLAGVEAGIEKAEQDASMRSMAWCQAGVVHRDCQE